LLLCSKVCGHCVHTKHKKVRSAGIGLARLKAGHCRQLLNKSVTLHAIN